MSWLVNEAVKQFLKLHMKRVERYMKDPSIAQEQWMLKLVDAAKNTEFGKKHNFAAIRNYEDFASRVPVCEYESIKGDIHRMMCGESDILWPGVTNWYAKSSGTTSDKSKFIPVTRDNLHNGHIAGSWDSMALLYDNRPDLEIFRRKNLVMSGSYENFKENPQTRFGDVSSILTEHLPPIARLFYAPEIDVMLQSNFETKIAQIAEKTSERDDIVMFAGVPTWIIVLFRMILEKTGKKHMLEVWPHLQAYMHGGVGFEPYRDTFKELIPDDNFAFQEIYNASEGYFGAQCDLKVHDMLLLADSGVFYEFIPSEEWNKPYPKAVPIWGVETHKNYAVAITSNNGLWRYLPGDTMMFTRKNPHCFQITGRTKQFINAFGEEVMVGDADKALAETCRQMEAVVAEYTAAPVYFSGSLKGKGGHEWVVEFEKEPQSLDNFNAVLDETLQKINSDYEAKRFKGMALERLQLRTVPKGTFHRWMKSRGKFGNQNKVPRLANNREYVDEILKFTEEPFA